MGSASGRRRPGSGPGRRKPAKRRPTRRSPARAAAAPRAAAATPARTWLERHSARPLLTLTRLPSWVVPLVFAIVLFTGLLVPTRWGALPLALVGAFLVWLAALSWPTTTRSGRIARLLAIALLLALIGVKLSGR